MSASPTVSSRRLRWALALPNLGVILLVTAIIALLWMLQKNEVEEERQTLIKDVLWLEQNLRFHLNGNEEQLQLLARDLVGQPEPGRIFRLRAEHLLKNNPNVAYIAWLDIKGATIDAVPAAPEAATDHDAFASAAARKVFSTAVRINAPVYSEPYTGSGDTQHFQINVPVHLDSRVVGMLVAAYPFEALLASHVPWWFAEKYRVIITDHNDIRYGAKSNIEGTPKLDYEIPFDPPGHGLVFRVSSYQSATNPLQRVLAGAILVLAGGVLWGLWVARDLIKKRSRAEEALRAEHALRSAMEDSLTVGMRARDLSGTIIYVNPAFCRMTGFSREELVGQTPPMAYWVPEQLDETMAVHQAVLDGKAPPDGFEITFRRKNDERFQALIYEAPLIDGDGKHTGWMASVLDVTERRRTEELARQQQEQLQHTSRLVTMGEMASTLAHELNQPLAAIISYNTGCLNLLFAGNAAPEDIKMALEKLGVQAQRAGRIIRRVHEFVRKSKPQRTPCDLRDVIDDCLGFIEAEARKRRITIEAELPSVPPVLADRLMLEQVLLNLIRNGMDAMAATPARLRVLKVRLEPGDDEVVISVADNGCGISPEAREKMFTAFFTTKPEGMGVGLSICRSIIEVHRGRLWAEDNAASPAGRGTLFRFTLPLESA